MRLASNQNRVQMWENLELVVNKIHCHINALRGIIWKLPLKKVFYFLEQKTYFYLRVHVW